MAGIGVEAGRRPEMVGSPDRAELDEQFEHAIDGGARDLRDLRLDRLVDLIGGRVIVPLRHRLEDSAPLYRQRKARLAAALLEGAQPLGNLGRTLWHGALSAGQQSPGTYARRPTESNARASARRADASDRGNDSATRWIGDGVQSRFRGRRRLRRLSRRRVRRLPPHRHGRRSDPAACGIGPMRTLSPLSRNIAPASGPTRRCKVSPVPSGMPRSSSVAAYFSDPP